MARPLLITRLEDGQYEVTVWLGGWEEVAVGPLASQDQTDLVCDLLTIKAALDKHQPLAALRLRSQAGPPTFQLSPQAAELVDNTDWEGLVVELLECVEELQTECWHNGASPGCSAAGMLLLGAAILGDACTAQLLLLLQPGAAAAKGGAERASPFHHAAQEGQISIMQAILTAMPSAVDLRTDPEDSSTLHHAASTVQPAAVRLLLQVRPALAAHPSSKTGALPLHMAALAGQRGAEGAAVEETIRLLLEAAPETAMAADKEGELPLHWAVVELGSEVAVRALLNAAPAAAMVANHDGMLPVHMAAEQGSAPVLRLLLDAAPDSITASLLIAAAPQGNFQNAQDVYGWRPVHHAAANDCPAVLSCLFDSAPAAEQALAIASDGSTPLHFAAEHGSVAAAEVLLEVAPEACQLRNAEGRTPLAVAAGYGHEGMVALLLASVPQAALLAAEEDNAVLPIYIAAEMGHVAVVARLLAARSELATAVMAECRTPLSVALQYCQDSGKRDAVARVLLPAGSASLALESLEEEAELDSQHLLPDFVGTRLPLSDDVWAQLARPCPGLGPLLPAALAHGTEQAQQLVRHLPAADAAQLRLAALCLARAQQRTDLHLPPAITGVLLALSCG